MQHYNAASLRAAAAAAEAWQRAGTLALGLADLKLQMAAAHASVKQRKEAWRRIISRRRQVMATVAWLLWHSGANPKILMLRQRLLSQKGIARNFEREVAPSYVSI